MPWREVTPVSERLNLCRLAVEGRHSISELARDFGVSRKTVHKWLSRYQEQGDVGVFDRSRRPNASPASIDQNIADRVLALKKLYPMWGPRKLHRLLADEASEAMCSRSTVGRILERAGLTDRRESSPSQEAVGRFERASANDLWQIDFTAPFVSSSGDKIWPVPGLDDHSRYCLAVLAVPSCSTSCALECFEVAARTYGLPQQVLSDHGGAFGTSRSYVSEFTAYLWASGVEHIQGRYSHPQTQGKLERFNQTLKRECITRNSYSTLGDWGKCFEEYRHIYNDLRPHESLCDCTPASRYMASERAFSAPDRAFREPGADMAHRKVDCSGKIWLLQHHVKVGNGLAGWIVSARHDGNGFWTIFFRGHSICQVSLAKQAQYKPRP